MKVKINNQTWLIEFKTNLSVELQDRIGVCIYTEQRICISIGILKEMQKRVLIHELTHAFEYAHGLTERNGVSKTEDLALFNENFAEQIVNMATKIMEGLK